MIKKSAIENSGAHSFQVDFYNSKPRGGIKELKVCILTIHVLFLYENV